jgi:hypothetical protein
LFLVNFDETDSGAAVLARQDGSETSRWEGDVDAGFGRVKRVNGKTAAIVIGGNKSAVAVAEFKGWVG